MKEQNWLTYCPNKWCFAGRNVFIGAGNSMENVAVYPFIEQYSMRQGTYPRQMSIILAQKFGDVDGDGVGDRVILSGRKTPDSPYLQDFTLVVQNGRTQKQSQIPLQHNQGYNPSLFLGDFTGDRAENILVISDTGGSGGTINAELFMYRQGQYKEIFNDEHFNNRFKYDVAYQDQYKVNVISHELKEKYILDLQYKGTEYLNEIYTNQGKLMKPINGWVNPLSGLYPIDFNRDGIYELLAYQRIAGQYNADSLGFIQTTLAWNGQRLEPTRQDIAIVGGEL